MTQLVENCTTYLKKSIKILKGRQAPFFKLKSIEVPAHAKSSDPQLE